MIIGYDYWGEENDGLFFQTNNPLRRINHIRLSGGVIDRLHLQNNGIRDDELLYDAQKHAWDINTVILAEFQNNLIGGVVGVDGSSIKYLRIKKRKQGESLWQTYYTIPYEQNVIRYLIEDLFVEGEQAYEYAIYPLAEQAPGEYIQGRPTPAQPVYVSFDHAHIFDGEQAYDLIYDLNVGPISGSIGAAIIETLGSRYPYVTYGAKNYRRASVSCLLVSRESLAGCVDAAAEKQLRQRIFSFLTNKKPKIIKNADGLYVLCEISADVQLTPTNTIVGLYNLSFEYTEIGDAHDAALLAKLGLLAGDEIG